MCSLPILASGKSSQTSPIRALVATRKPLDIETLWQLERVSNIALAPDARKKNLELMENLKRLATDRGVTVAQLALAWVFHQPGVTAAIAGSRSSTHTAENAGAGKVALSEADLDEIESLL